MSTIFNFKKMKNRKIRTMNKSPYQMQRNSCKRLDVINSDLCLNHYYEQRTYIAEINLHYEMNRLPLLDGEKIRIHFAYLSPSLWSSWNAFYHACVADVRLAVKVIFLDTRSNDLGAEYVEAESFLLDRGISYVPYSSYDPYVEKPHVIVYQVASDDVYLNFSKLRANFIKKYGIRPMYIVDDRIYEMSIDESHTNLSTKDIKELFGQYVHMFAWKIISMCNITRENFYLHCLQGGYHVSILENDKFDLNNNGEKIKNFIFYSIVDECKLYKK